jgi:hypothetical protein
MDPARWNIRTRQGSTFTLPFTIDDDDVLWDLTGYTARMQIRPYVESPRILLSLTDTDGIALGGTAGSVSVTFSAAVLAGIVPGTHVYDLELVPPSGVVYPILEGKFIVKPEVTQ